MLGLQRCDDLVMTGSLRGEFNKRSAIVFSVHPFICRFSNEQWTLNRTDFRLTTFDLRLTVRSFADRGNDRSDHWWEGWVTLINNLIPRGSYSQEFLKRDARIIRGNRYCFWVRNILRWWRNVEFGTLYLFYSCSFDGDEQRSSEHSWQAEMASHERSDERHFVQMNAIRSDERMNAFVNLPS